MLFVVYVVKMFWRFILHVTTSKTFLQMFCKCFILRVTTYYLQHVVFNILKHLKKNVLQIFCNSFANVLA